MKELNTLMGTEVPITTRGILYLCEIEGDVLNVKGELITDEAFNALEAYANIPNPESQLVIGKSFDELMIKLNRLHDCMKSPEWVEELRQTL